MSKYLSKSIWAVWNVLGRRAARSYIAGPELNDALRVCRELSSKGFSSTIGYWDGEGDTPDQVAGYYLAEAETLKGGNMDCYLSVKLPALSYSGKLLLEVLRASKREGIRVHFDALGPESVNETWKAIAEAIPIYDNLSCTLPARWRRSPEDADWAIEQGLKVRVVKGQWSDPEATDIDMRAGFLNVIDRLAGRARFVAVATHDTKLAKEAIGRLEKAGTPCEMELLYGLPARESVNLARNLGIKVRFYIPYGSAYLPYCLSHVRHNPHVLAWILKALVKDALHGNQLSEI